MTRERPTCRECACTKVCEYFENENGKNLDELCPLCNWEKYFVPKREWMSVDERLPERNGRYLTHCKIENQSLVCILYYCKIGGFNEGTVTHWMPLPQPPETKGETE